MLWTFLNCMNWVNVEEGTQNITWWSCIETTKKLWGKWTTDIEIEELGAAWCSLVQPGAAWCSFRLFVESSNLDHVFGVQGNLIAARSRENIPTLSVHNWFDDVDGLEYFLNPDKEFLVVAANLEVNPQHLLEFDRLARMNQSLIKGRFVTEDDICHDGICSLKCSCNGELRHVNSEFVKTHVSDMTIARFSFLRDKSPDIAGLCKLR